MMCLLSSASPCKETVDEGGECVQFCCMKRGGEKAAIPEGEESTAHGIGEANRRYTHHINLHAKGVSDICPIS